MCSTIERNSGLKLEQPYNHGNQGTAFLCEQGMQTVILNFRSPKKFSSSVGRKINIHEFNKSNYKKYIYETRQF